MTVNTENCDPLYNLEKDNTYINTPVCISFGHGQSSNELSTWYGIKKLAKPPNAGVVREVSSSVDSPMYFASGIIAIAQRKNTTEGVIPV